MRCPKCDANMEEEVVVDAKFLHRKIIGYWCRMCGNRVQQIKTTVLLLDFEDEEELLKYIIKSAESSKLSIQDEIFSQLEAVKLSEGR